MYRAVVVMALLGACYEPELGDCAVPCADDGDCATGLRCGADGWCARPAHLGRCEAGDDLDGGLGVPDAPEVPTIGLRLIVEGRGRVVGDQDDAACEAEGNEPADCSVELPIGVAIRLDAIETHPHWRFERWDGACEGDGACELVLDESLDVIARFERRD